MRTKFVTLFLSVLLLLACTLTGYAQPLEPDRTGSVSVTLTDLYDEQPVAGAQLSFYYVASVTENAAGNLSYVCTEEFQDLEVSLDDPMLAEELEIYTGEQQPAARIVVTDAQGTAVLTELPLGLYFVKQTAAVEGFEPCTPFVVTVPAKEELGYVYDVEASPKTDVIQLVDLTITKVWNTDKAASAADQVTVQLLCDGQLLETIVLNEENDWQVTFTDMPKSDAYSIKEIDVPKGFVATYTEDGYDFTVINTSSLIQTGQLVWPIPVLALTGLILLAGGALILRKARNEHA